MRSDVVREARHAGGMDNEIPDFGDEVGLRRLVVRTIRRIRPSDMADREKLAWIAEIERQYRACRDLPKNYRSPYLGPSGEGNSLIEWRSQRDSNPRTSLERAVSWASRRWERGRTAD